MSTLTRRLRRVVLAVSGLVLVANCSYLPVGPKPTQALKSSAQPAAPQSELQVVGSYGKLPLYFIENRGQVDPTIKFYEKGRGHATYFTKEGVYFALANGEKGQKAKTGEKGPDFTTELVKLVAVGSNRSSRIVADGEQDGKVNYFVGNDSTKWRTNVPTYQAVVYQGIYPGIDLRFHGSNRQLEYDVIVAPGADPSAVVMAYEGIQDLAVTGEGDLEIKLKHGTIMQRKPVVYQEIAGKRVPVDGRFKIITGDSVAQRSPPAGSHAVAYTFEVASYDRTTSLIIDPVLAYSTYLGGVSPDQSYGIAVDASGHAYITGIAEPGFPATPGSYDTTADGGAEAFIVKLDPSGSSLVYATFLGGSAGAELARALAIDGLGNVFVTGWTNSTDFPTTPGAYDTTHNGSLEGFVTKLDATGSSLIYSTFVRVSDNFGTKIAIDSSGSAYVTGYTTASDYPTTPGAYDTSYNGGMDVFVLKLDPSGSSLNYSTYLGGSQQERFGDIAVDGSGNAYVVGTSLSPDFPTTPGAYDTTFDSSISNAFLVKLNPSGSSLVYATFLPGSGLEAPVEVDGAGNAYVVTEGGPGLSATPGAFDVTHNGSLDLFACKLDSSGAVLLYGTYIGGSSVDRALDLAVDSTGSVYATGFTASLDFPVTPGAVATNASFNGDLFVVKLNPSGSGLLYGTYMGGDDADFGLGIAEDGSGNVYVSGWSSSSDFPSSLGAYDETPNGESDVVVVKLALTPKLFGISTRARVQTSDNVMIGGFWIGGSDPKTVLIRARGGSLGGAPFFNPGVLANPTMQLFSGSTAIAQNDNWQVTDPLCLSPATACGGASEISGSGMDPCQPNPGQSVAPPGCAQESALYVTLPPGGYTAIVRGVAATSGMGLVEVFEIDSIQSPLISISTRARVETVDNVMIGGFVVEGGATKTLLIRVRGGSLAGPPFNNPAVLANPQVQLYSGSTIIAQNDNWQSTDPLCLSPAVACGDGTQIAATGLDPCQPNPGEVSAPPGCSQEGALHVTLPPGGYTAIVSGVGGTVGMGLVEVFEVFP